MERIKQKNHLDRFREAQNGYSKGTKNRIIAMLDASRLILVGGEHEGKMAKSPQLLEYISDNPFVQDSSEAQELNTRLVTALGDLLLVGNTTTETYVEGIGGFDYQAVPTLAAELATKPRDHKIAIRVVQGATTEMPFRALSYIVPPLVLMDKLQKDGFKPPQLQFIAAHHISGGLNGLPEHVTGVQAKQFADVASNYVDMFFPELADSVVFLQDGEIQKDSDLRDELINIARIVYKKVSGNISDALRTKGENNGSSRMYAFYAAAHLLMHDRDFPGSLRPILADSKDPVSPETIVSIGGKQEDIFYKLRHEVKPFLDHNYNRVQTLQYFTRHVVPPYYMARGGDISLDAVIKGEKSTGIAATARYDLDFLENVTYRRGDLDEFIEKQRRKAA
jgi:hypothetical protein